MHFTSYSRARAGELFASRLQRVDRMNYRIFISQLRFSSSFQIVPSFNGFPPALPAAEQ